MRPARLERVASDAADLNDDERAVTLERFNRARLMFGGSDDLAQLRAWKLPEER